MEKARTAHDNPGERNDLPPRPGETWSINAMVRGVTFTARCAIASAGRSPLHDQMGDADLPCL